MWWNRLPFHESDNHPLALLACWKWDLKIFFCNMGSLRGGERSHGSTLFTFFIFYAAVEKNNAFYAWSNTICIHEDRMGNILENLAFNLSFLWFTMCFLLRLCMYAIFTQEQLKWRRDLRAAALYTEYVFSVVTGSPVTIGRCPAPCLGPVAVQRGSGQPPASRTRGGSCLCGSGAGQGSRSLNASCPGRLASNDNY